MRHLQELSWEAVINDLALILSGLGVGGLLGAYAKALLDKQQLKFSKLFDYKEARYKALAILMWVAMNPTEYELTMLRKHRPEIKDAGDLDRELQLEYHNAMIFASDQVLQHLNSFMAQKDEASWQAVTRAMKRDLYL